MIKVELEALDNKFITPRTEKSKVNATVPAIPQENDYAIFMYENEPCPSPGVAIEINCLERLGNEYKFYDSSHRPFIFRVK